MSELPISITHSDKLSADKLELKDAPDTYEEAREHLGTINQESGQLYERIEQECELLEPGLWHEIVQAAQEKLDDMDETSFIEQQLANYPKTDEHHVAIIDALHKISQLRADYNVIEAKAFPLGQERLASQREALVRDVDWEKMIDRLLSDPKEPAYRLKYDQLFRLVSNGIPEWRNSYDGVQLQMESLQWWRTGLEQDGDLRELAISAPQDEEKYVTPEDEPLAEAIKQWVYWNKRAITYAVRGRQRILVEALHEDQLETLGDLARYAGLSNQVDSETQTPSNIALLLAKKAADYMQELDTTDQRNLATKDEKVRGLFIDHTELLIPIVGATRGDVAEWISAVVAELPSDLTEGLGLIDIMLEDPKAKDDPNSTWSAIADMDPGENRIRLFVSHIIENFEENEASKDKIEDYTQVLKHKLKHTIWHELGHYIHRQKLSIKWLREWEQAISQEDVHVTKYVERKHTTPDPTRDPLAAHHEDLAESISECKQYPLTFQVNTPRRYAQLSQFVGYESA